MVDPLNGELWRCDQGDVIEWLNSLPEKSVDLCFGSPPYCDARTYGIAAQRDCLTWVNWMLDVTEAAVRVCRGPVFWVAAGVTRGRNYWPACEGLLWEWWKRGGEHHLYRPCCWHKVDGNGGGTGIPGSGGDDYLRADWEYVLCFKRPGKLAWSDNTACGAPPVYAAVGGEMSNRTIEGQRINADVGRETVPRRQKWGGPGKRSNGKTKKGSRQDDPWNLGKRKSGAGGRNQDGSKKVPQMYAPEGHDAEGNLNGSNGKRPMPKLANPGNFLDFPPEVPAVVNARVGGGHMGSRLCHEGEAPFPEKLVEFFVRTFCPPGGICCDPFSGSGTTFAVAVRWGRRALACDLRQSQVDLTRRRVAQEVDLFTQAPTPPTDPPATPSEPVPGLFDHCEE